MDLIHHIDVVDQLMSAGCNPGPSPSPNPTPIANPVPSPSLALTLTRCAALSDWSWRKQLRFYTTDQQVVKMVRARVRVRVMVRVTAGVGGRLWARLGLAEPPH